MIKKIQLVPLPNKVGRRLLFLPAFLWVSKITKKVEECFFMKSCENAKNGLQNTFLDFTIMERIPPKMAIMWSDCQQHYEKSTEIICMEFSVMLCYHPRTKWWEFGSDQRVHISANEQFVILIVAERWCKNCWPDLHKIF